MSFPAKYPSLNETTLSDEAKAILERIIRVAFPHANFPDGAYRRMRDKIVVEAEASTWFRVVLTQGLLTIDAQLADGEHFLDLPQDRALEVLRGVQELEFFGFIRRTTVLNLYDDPEVLEVLGYEGGSFAKGGYLHRGFDDLDWLPQARIEESDEPLVETGPLPYEVSTTAGTAAVTTDAGTIRETSGGSRAAAAAGPRPHSGVGAVGTSEQPGATP